MLRANAPTAYQIAIRRERHYNCDMKPISSVLTWGLHGRKPAVGLSDSCVESHEPFVRWVLDVNQLVNGFFATTSWPSHHLLVTIRHGPPWPAAFSCSLVVLALLEPVSFWTCYFMLFPVSACDWSISLCRTLTFLGWFRPLLPISHVDDRPELRLQGSL